MREERGINLKRKERGRGKNQIDRQREVERVKEMRN